MPPYADNKQPVQIYSAVKKRRFIAKLIQKLNLDKLSENQARGCAGARCRSYWSRWS